MTGDVRFGILGAGAVAWRFASAARAVPGARLQAVASRDPRRAADLAARFGVARACETYDDLARDASVDVVYVATPTDVHRDHALLALTEGKHVLCEKPLATSAEEARAIVAEARRRRLFCMEAMWMRCSPAFRSALEAVHEGAVGAVQLVSAEMGFPYAADGAHRIHAPRGGGALLDLGVYALSACQAVLGSPTLVRSVARTGPAGADDLVTVMLAYSGGARAVASASLAAQLANGATICGSDAVLRIAPPLYFPERYSVERTPRQRPMERSAPGPLARLKRAAWVRRVAGVGRRARVRHVDVPPRGDGFEYQIAEVVRCIRAAAVESALVPLDDSVAVLETVDAARAEWARAG